MLCGKKEKAHKLHNIIPELDSCTPRPDMLSFPFEEIKISTTHRQLIGLCWGLSRENQHVRVPVSNTQRWGHHSRPEAVYHRGRPEHWHWTLSHLKEGGGTAQGISSHTKGEATRHGRILSTAAGWQILHDAVIVKKHAAKSLSETKAQRSQPPDDGEVVH